MKREELYRNVGFNSTNIVNVLYANYSNYIDKESNRIAGYTSNDITERVLKNTSTRLSEISQDCDISCLVFDCLRKEILADYKQSLKSYDKVSNLLLTEAEFNYMEKENDDLRLDVVLLFLSTKQRKYFLERYYYLRDDIKINKRYEKIIFRLFNGKGIASFRFRYFQIPNKKVTSKRYVDYLDRLDASYLEQFSKKECVLIAHKISGVSATCVIAEHQYNIAKYSVPISLVFVLFLFLFFFINTI